VKVAALYDVHGNLPALEAVLAEPDVQAAGRIVVGGDLVLGPFPTETFDLLLGLGFHAALIRGNCERLLAEPQDDSLWGRRTTWVAERLGQEPIDRLLALPSSVTVDVDGHGQVLFCHASPRSDDEILTAQTPATLMREAAAGTHEPTIVVGHTHVQFDRDVGGRRYVNAGSVGLAYEGLAGAYWALLGEEVELRRTAYDVHAAAERILATGFPEARELVETLTHPPSADDATAHFERAAGERGER
jgi:predicted phosphodiesterase